jgi:flagellar biosynthesis/type III secretory pathway chaperone
MQRDGIRDYIEDIIVNVTSSLDNANLRGGWIINTWVSEFISGRATLIEVSRVHATIWLYARRGYVHDEFSKNPSVPLVLSWGLFARGK